MKRFFTDRSIGFYVGLSSVVFALATIIAGLIQPGFAQKSFDWLVILFLGLGIAAQIATIFLRTKFASLMPIPFYAIAIGIIAHHGAPIVMDLIHKINFLNGNGRAVIVYAVLTLLCCIAAIIPCFTGTEKEAVNE